MALMQTLLAGPANSHATGPTRHSQTVNPTFRPELFSRAKATTAVVVLTGEHEKIEHLRKQLIRHVGLSILHPIHRTKHAEGIVTRAPLNFRNRKSTSIRSTGTRKIGRIALLIFVPAKTI